MYIKNTGGVGEPPSKEVDAYLWTIPAGWKQTSTPNVGPVTISTTASTIQIEPIGSGGGSVYAVGSVKNSCGQGVSDSNPTTITLVRTPALTVSPTAGGSYTAKCGLTAQVSFTVTAPPCATTYSWNIPSGWSGSSTSSSIVVTPNGLNGGTLSVAIGLSTGSSVTVSRDIPYSNEVPPALSLSKNSPHSELCVGDSFVYTATLPPGYPANFGFDWYASSGILINGLSSSTTVPVHTSTNSVTVTAAGQAYGTKFIHARLNNTVCSPGFYGTKETRVGVFSNSEFSITGPSSVCPNTAADFTSSLIGGSVTGYQWTAPNGWSYSGQGTPYFHVSVPYSFSGGEAITLRLMNRCGITNTPYVRQLYSGYCGYSFSPNPVSNILTVSDLNLKSDETAQAVLLDKSNRGVKTGTSREGKIELDVSDLPTGQYVLLVRYKGRTETQNIIVER